MKDVRPSPARRHLAVLALFTAATLAMTYPMPLRLGDSLADPPDPLLNCWILAWSARHILALDFQGLFGGNIFYPDPWVLTYSDHLLGWQPVVLPVYALTGNIVLAHNLAFLISTVLAGYCMNLLARHLTGSEGAAVFAGLAFAFVPFRFQHAARLQLSGCFWMPLALLCLHRLLGSGVWGLASGVRDQRPRAKEQGLASAPLPPGPRPLAPGPLPQVRWGLWAGVAVAMQFHMSLYEGLFLALLVAMFAVFLAPASGAWRRWRFWAGALGGAAVAAASTGWFVVLYRRAHALLGLGRGMHEIEAFSSTMTDYLRVPFRCRLLSALGMPTLAREQNAWLGIVVVALAVVGLVTAVALRSPASPSRIQNLKSRIAWFLRPPIFYALAAVLFWLFTLGPKISVSGGEPIMTGPYKWIVSNVPGFDGIRVPARMSLMVSLCLTVLAGMGVAWLARRVRGRRLRSALVLLLCLLVLAEFFPAPLASERVPMSDDARAFCAWLAGEPPGTAVCHLPFPRFFHKAWDETYLMYLSTFHWQPLVNGYSGHRPPISHFISEKLAPPVRRSSTRRSTTSTRTTGEVRPVSLAPSPEALRALQVLGVRYVIYGADPNATLDGVPALIGDPPAGPVQRFGRITVFAVPPRLTGPVPIAGLSPRDVELRVFMAFFLDARTDDEVYNAKEAFRHQCRRTADKDYCVGLAADAIRQSGPAVRLALAQVLDDIRTFAAARVLAEAAFDPAPPVRDFARRSLAQWRDPAVAPFILEIIRAEADAERLIPIRAYCRLVLADAARSPDERVKAHLAVMEVCRTDEERRAVVASLGYLPDLAALAALEGFLEDAALCDRAAGAIAKIAPAIAADHPLEARAALHAALRAAQHPEVRNAVRAALDALPGRPG
jgi:hypothetical protein